MAAALVACSSETPVLQIDVTTGYETDAMQREPAVTRVDVVATTVADGTRITASAAPGGSFDLGDIAVDEALTFEITGVTATGETVVRGRSLAGIYVGAVEGDTVRVFAQRTDGWARPPGALERAHVDAPAGVVGERFLLSTGGEAAKGSGGSVDPKATEYYDLFSYGPAQSEPFGRAAKSVVARPASVLLIDDAGATFADFSTDLVSDVAAPAGLGSFSDVAGGRTIEAPDGISFVVGATRSTTETRAVVQIADSGALTYVPLAHARRGAAAAWVEHVGLVVVGGSPDAPGVELLPEGATTFSARDYPPDATEGAGASTTALGLLALVGGTAAGSPAPTRTLDPSCSGSCALTEVAAASLPIALAQTVAFATTAGTLVAIGDESATAERMTRAFLVDLGTETATELPLREPRAGARAVAAPNGTLALLGGLHVDSSPALTVEAFFP